MPLNSENGIEQNVVHNDCCTRKRNEESSSDEEPGQKLKKPKLLKSSIRSKRSPERKAKKKLKKRHRSKESSRWKRHMSRQVEHDNGDINDDETDLWGEGVAVIDELSTKQANNGINPPVEDLHRSLQRAQIELNKKKSLKTSKDKKRKRQKSLKRKKKRKKCRKSKLCKKHRKHCHKSKRSRKRSKKHKKKRQRCHSTSSSSSEYSSSSSSSSSSTSSSSSSSYYSSSTSSSSSPASSSSTHSSSSTSRRSCRTYNSHLENDSFESERMTLKIPQLTDSRKNDLTDNLYFPDLDCDIDEPQDCFTPTNRSLCTPLDDLENVNEFFPIDNHVQNEQDELNRMLFKDDENDEFHKDNPPTKVNSPVNHENYCENKQNPQENFEQHDNCQSEWCYEYSEEASINTSCHEQPCVIFPNNDDESFLTPDAKTDAKDILPKNVDIDESIDKPVTSGRSLIRISFNKKSKHQACLTSIALPADDEPNDSIDVNKLLVPEKEKAENTENSVEKQVERGSEVMDISKESTILHNIGPHSNQMDMITESNDLNDTLNSETIPDSRIKENTSGSSSESSDESGSESSSSNEVREKVAFLSNADTTPESGKKVGDSRKSRVEKHPLKNKLGHSLKEEIRTETVSDNKSLEPHNDEHHCRNDKSDKHIYKEDRYHSKGEEFDKVNSKSSYERHHSSAKSDNPVKHKMDSSDKSTYKKGRSSRERSRSRSKYRSRSYKYKDYRSTRSPFDDSDRKSRSDRTSYSNDREKVVNSSGSYRRKQDKPPSRNTEKYPPKVGEQNHHEISVRSSRTYSDYRQRASFPGTFPPYRHCLPVRFPPFVPPGLYPPFPPAPAFPTWGNHDFHPNQLQFGTGQPATQYYYDYQLQVQHDASEMGQATAARNTAHSDNSTSETTKEGTSKSVC